MSQYYQYKFTTPTGIYAIIKEELKSYFDTGAVDDVLFPTYTRKCMQKLSRGMMPIKEVPLFIEDFQARLPDNFYAVREAWMCAEMELWPYQEPNSFYSQSGTTTIQIHPVTIGGVSCDAACPPNCPDHECPDVPEVIEQGVYKTNTHMPRTYRQLYLLKPGNISTKEQCGVGYFKNWSSYGQTPGSSTIDSFDIRGNKFFTNFRQGTVHLIFYADEVDCNGDQLVPDNYRIMEYIELFIKYKVFETLANQTNDETFNQIQQKMMMYKQMADEAFILADIESKKETMYKKIRKINKDKRRFRHIERLTPEYNRIFKHTY